jgi:uncharacterized membrane protein YphA (DoxX/SURF4 family)
VKGLPDWSGWPLVCLLARVYLGGVFLMACWHKILDPASFAVDIATYQMLPVELVNPMAVVLPWIELLAGLMMVLGLGSRASGLLVSGMMAVFIVAVTSAWQRGLQMSCGCFASKAMAEDPISGLTVLRDLGWLALGLVVLFFDRRPLGLDRFVGRWLGQRRSPAAS